MSDAENLFGDEQWPDYDTYRQRADREIPVVVLERV